jgi:hypothetical protein
MRNQPATARQAASRGPARRLLYRRVWLPGYLYAALPFLYLLLGILALASGIWLPDPGWVLGYLLLISAGCMHAGVWFMMLRRRRRHSRLRRSRAQRSPCSPVPGSAHRL